MNELIDLPFGEWLKRRRKSLGLTQEELAQQLNCSTIMLRKIEAEERRPSATMIEQLAKILNIPQSEQKKFQRFARGNMRSFTNEPAEIYPWQANAALPRSNLPPSVTSFIGREQELSLIRKYILDTNIRLITLIGPPGIGKTRLGLQVARASLSDFPDNAFFVPLAPLDKSSQIAPVIFQALGYVESKNQFTLEQLLESIGDKKILIMLDNLEHVIEDSASLVSRLLSACPGLKILATSRESLRVPGEWLFPVPVLDFPKETIVVDLEDTFHFPALTLFAERARAVSPGFSLNSENVRAVASICARLDGVPLAIELIASRVRFLSPQRLLGQMDEQFILSADGMRAVPARQKTLQNAIQWSYSLLTSQEQEMLMSLSVFSGGFSMDAAEAIFADLSTKKSVTDLIASLLDKSLLQRSPDKYDGSHFNMLMMIREFAWDQLRKAGKESGIRDKHLAYFLGLAEKVDQEIHGPDQITWMERVEKNHTNFQAALDWSVTNQYTEYAIRLLAALAWTWWIRGHYSESHSWLEKIRALPEVSNHPAKYAILLNRVAGQNWNIGNDREAQSLLQESQRIWLSLGERGELGLADCLNWMSYVAFDGEGDVAKAGLLAEKGLALHKKHADPWGCANSMLTAGYVQMGRDRSGSPLFWLERSLDLFQQVGDIWGKSQAYQLMGRVYLDIGELEKAHFCFGQQMTMDQSVRYISGIVNGLCDLGHVHFLKGQDVQAQQYYEKSLALGRQYGMKPDRAPQFYLCMVALYQNNFHIAAQRFIALYNDTEEKGKKRDVLTLLSGLAAVNGGTNQPERSAKLSGAAEAILDKTGYHYPPFFRGIFDRHIQVARDQLGEKKFEMLASVGRTMTMEQAIAYALEDQE